MGMDLIAYKYADGRINNFGPKISKAPRVQYGKRMSMPIPNDNEEIEEITIAITRIFTTTTTAI